MQAQKTNQKNLGRKKIKRKAIEIEEQFNINGNDIIFFRCKH